MNTTTTTQPILARHTVFSAESTPTDYERIEKAIAFIEANFRQQPSLDQIAASVQLSKFHFQRLFKRWAGVTPTQFMHALTVEYAKGQLANAHTVFDTALDAGLSGAGRLHDMFVNIEAMTPGEYKQQAAGLTITYGIHDTPFGAALLATTPRGICALRFLSEETKETTLANWQAEWPQATFTQDNVATQPYINQIFANQLSDKPLKLALKGTNFQVQVWQALLNIPSGSLVTYQDVAEGIGKPKATRAVASAIAKNPVGYLIPCHRVISKAGKAHNYRWGSARKKALIGYEAAALT